MAILGRDTKTFGLAVLAEFLTKYPLLGNPMHYTLDFPDPSIDIVPLFRITLDTEAWEIHIFFEPQSQDVVAYKYEYIMSIPEIDAEAFGLALLDEFQTKHP
ncbi:hypothetical protein CDAR_5761 [Caerostris darwini]|uniref:Uncharacterized protein n=1 Tax=Caerostris darwini TaxID=1538125 RepID=A0AAV4REK6_9ARAC|nr:hypothetical protein CDAR_5761 [Caerostris darwini]